MKHLKLLSLIALAAVFGITACEDDPDDHDHDHDQELITTVTLTLTETGTNNTTTVTWQDLDGEGGNNPTIGTLSLAAGTSYTGTVSLLNESESPAENITEEVEEEADEHQFFYSTSGTDAGRIDIQITDTDVNNLPVGLAYTVTVSGTDAGSATLRVVLGHYDDVPKDGTTMSPESDVDIEFPVTIGASGN